MVDIEDNYFDLADNVSNRADCRLGGNGCPKYKPRKPRMVWVGVEYE